MVAPALWTGFEWLVRHLECPSCTVEKSEISSRDRRSSNPEEFSEDGVVGLAGFALDVFLSTSQYPYFQSGLEHTKSLVNQNRKTSSMRPTSSSDLPILA